MAVEKLRLIFKRAGNIVSLLIAGDASHSRSDPEVVMRPNKWVFQKKHEEIQIKRAFVGYFLVGLFSAFLV